MNTADLCYLSTILLSFLLEDICVGKVNWIYDLKSLVMVNRICDHFLKSSQLNWKSCQASFLFTQWRVVEFEDGHSAECLLMAGFTYIASTRSILSGHSFDLCKDSLLLSSSPSDPLHRIDTCLAEVMPRNLWRSAREALIRQGLFFLSHRFETTRMSCMRLLVWEGREPAWFSRSMDQI